MSVSLWILLVAIIITAAVIDTIHYNHDEMRRRWMDVVDNRVKELSVRIDTLDRGVGDLIIRLETELKAQNIRITELTNNCEKTFVKMDERVNILEDLSGELESVGNLVDDVKGSAKKIKELDKRIKHLSESVEGFNDVATDISNKLEEQRQIWLNQPVYVGTADPNVMLRYDESVPIVDPNIVVKCLSDDVRKIMYTDTAALDEIDDEVDD